MDVLAGTCARRLSSSSSASALSSLLRRFRLELVIDLRRAIPRTGKQGVSVALHQSIVGGKTGPCFEACLRCIIGAVLCDVPEIFLTGLCKDNRYLPRGKQKYLTNVISPRVKDTIYTIYNNNEVKGKEKGKKSRHSLTSYIIGHSLAFRFPHSRKLKNHLGA